MRVLETWQHQLMGPSYLVEFPNLDSQLHLIRGMISKWSGHPDVRNLALRIVRDAGLDTRDKPAMAQTIGRWVQDNITYIHELPERFQTPEVTIATAAGDCDDMNILIGALVEAIGVPVGVIAMEVNGAWRHIFPAAWIKDAFLPLDASLKDRIGTVNPVLRSLSKGKMVRLKIL